MRHHRTGQFAGWQYFNNLPIRRLQQLVEFQMSSILPTLALIAMASVGLILIYGLWNMMKGGDANLSQKLMRMRVITQAIAVALIVAAIYFSR
jgi:hypothetical protein